MPFRSWVLLLALSPFYAVAAEADLEATFPFAIGSSDLDDAMRARLAALAATLKRNATDITVEGHSDSAGGPEINEAVSRARAERVVAALVRRGVDPALIHVEVRSMRDPVASNATPEGRAKNRRVFIHAGVPETEVRPVAKVEKPAAIAAATSDTPLLTLSRREREVPAVETHDDTPRAEPVATLVPENTPPATVVTADTNPATHRPKFWLAVGTTVVAAAAAGTSVGFFADSAVVASDVARNNAQLARTDLYPATRTAFEANTAQLNAAGRDDVIAGSIAGAVAVAAVVTAIILWTTQN